MVAIYSVGSVSAAPFVPFVVDKMGRRFSIFLGGLISIVGGILQGSALNCKSLICFKTRGHILNPIVVMFIVARFILGFADVFCIVAASSLIGGMAK